VANQFHDVKDRLEEAFAPYVPEPLSGASAVSGGGWPVEQADIFVLDADRPLALCTLGDLELARSLASQGHPSLALIGPMATENLGVEKLVRNVVTNPAIRTIVLVGPETGGSAPTGHYAGDALLCLFRNGVDTHTKRILEAKGRRPFLKNLTRDEIGLFRDRVSVVDHRGLAEPATIRALVDTAADDLAGLEETHSETQVASAATTAPVAVPLVEVHAAARGFQKDPLGYFVIFCDHVYARLVVEHYTNEDERTLVIAGRNPGAIAQAVIERGLLGSLDHAVYLGRELERAAAALETGQAYVQDEGNE